jgi:serine beta-lactamase-like protein LACTB, mitochondrial
MIAMIPKIFVRRMTCVVILLISCGAFAQPAPAADRAAEIDAIVKREVEKQHIAGANVAVVYDGRVVYSKGAGEADIENGVPATAETLIRTGSISKPISAAAAMTLVDAGKLDLDAPIQKYCPAFPQKQSTITTRQLLSHTSGIRHYKGDEIASTKHFKSMSDGFAIFASDPLLFDPGTKYSYSTYGYTVVGCVIEGAAGRNYFDYVREHVLTPARMTHTVLDDVFDIVPHRSRGYQVMNGQVKNTGLMDSSYKIPGGGLVSTAEDLVRFAMALTDGKIVKAETLKMMWTPTNLPAANSGRPSNYGLGFSAADVDGQQWISHSGSQQGSSTDLEFVPGKHFAVAVFANTDGVRPAEIVRAIFELYGMPRPHPQQ